MFGVTYACLGIGLLLINTVTMATFPLLIGKIVKSFQMNSSEGNMHVLCYSLALGSFILLKTVGFHSYMFGIERLFIRTQIAFNGLIYRKCLALGTSSSSEVASGKVITLLTKDVNGLYFSIHFFHHLWNGVIQIVVLSWMMYAQIGIPALIAMLFFLLFVPVQVYLGKWTARFRLKTAAKTDERVKITQEMLTAIRIIKMYTWEKFFGKTVNQLRKREIKDLRILFYIKAIALCFGLLSSRFAFYICVMTYIALGNHITAEKAFIVTACFGALRAVLSTFMPLGIAQMAELKASLYRITNFLMMEEVPGNENLCEVKEPKICVKDVTVQNSSGAAILDKISISVSKGLTLVIGPTGTGKSTLLKLLLGDVTKAEGEIEMCGEVSYASQDPWLFPATVRQNIIFAEEFDEKRYRKVIEVCALEHDFDAFLSGDQTCVADHGLNLSKGQKARINLARAIYKKADIYLLDDCLSSVDSCVAQHIYNECIRRFLKDHLCLLVTHSALALDDTDHVLILSNGQLKFHGDFSSFKKLNDVNSVLRCNKLDEPQTLNKAGDFNDACDADESSLLLQSRGEVPNLYEESNREGQVDKAVYYAYFVSGGGLKMFLIVALCSVVAQATSSWSDYFVSFWVDMEQELSGFRLNQTTNSTEYQKLEESHDNVMRLYSFVMLGTAIFTILRAYTFYTFSSKASTNIHNSVVDRILNTGMMFFDNNLSGSVLNRFSRDLGIIDEQMPNVLFECSSVILSVLAVLFVVSSVNLYFIIPSTIFTAILYLARRFYMPTGRSLRRLEGATRSPVIGHLNATLDGLTTIRASKAQDILRKEFDKHQDLYSSVVYMNIATARAFGFYLDVTCCIYITVITLLFLFFKSETLAGKVGLAITQSYTLTGLLQWGIRQWAELENQMTSTERVLEYRNLDLEDKSGCRLDNWPNHGAIEYRNVSLRYFAGGERVLKNLNLHIKSKEKVGVVGRTGAGKTSVISALFRMYEYDGTILIDGIDIQSVAADYLRLKISIIPQDPVLFSGTVRSNLDPYSEHSDKTLWDALDEVEMKRCFKSLDATIVEGGMGMSVGQKQLFCLARAVVRDNSILVLDEATANIDLQTDALIQRTIKRRFSDCTVITIAHRLHTIMDSDNIIVMDASECVQFGPPSVLLADENNLFYGMVKEAGLL
ncbi:probable multidrug resistance-associated protein lethal(2)03659 isoform X2 [Photinus pyralis]|uniref:probable multidrug resistance-associated protein lethal(2)03659 isoform X2 n=3 Tax=Photinus pyralis TaxID=7054 RepID=UPI0012671BE7|nr:probable multidrug resistance-associated protein lethal(2)03659 isoform X2 [Photinus pyralis]